MSQKLWECLVLSNNDKWNTEWRIASFLFQNGKKNHGKVENAKTNDKACFVFLINRE